MISSAVNKPVRGVVDVFGAYNLVAGFHHLKLLAVAFGAQVVV